MDRTADRLARKIRELRGDQTKMAFAKKLGIAESSLNRIEQGTQNVTLATLDRLCRRLKWDVNELLNKSEPHPLPKVE